VGCNSNKSSASNLFATRLPEVFESCSLVACSFFCSNFSSFGRGVALACLRGDSLLLNLLGESCLDSSTKVPDMLIASGIVVYSRPSFGAASIRLRLPEKLPVWFCNMAAERHNVNPKATSFGAVTCFLIVVQSRGMLE